MNGITFETSMDQMAKIVASMFSSILGALSDVPRVETKIFPMLPDESLKFVFVYQPSSFEAFKTLHLQIFVSNLKIDLVNRYLAL